MTSTISSCCRISLCYADSLENTILLIRVVVGYSKSMKHALPVDGECPYWRRNSLPSMEAGVCRDRNSPQSQDLVRVSIVLSRARFALKLDSFMYEIHS